MASAKYVRPSQCKTPTSQGLICPSSIGVKLWSASGIVVIPALCLLSQAGRYHVTPDRTDYEGFLTFLQRRDLRETLWRAFADRCDGGAHDDWPIIAETLALRRERAVLLGYGDQAHYALEDSMAHDPAAATDLMRQLWEPGKRRAAEEAAGLQALIDEDGGGIALAPWDWRFYAEQVRRALYALDGTMVAAHLRLDAARQAAVNTAARLCGLSFTRRADIAGSHPDVWAREVTDKNGGAMGLLFTDYLARLEKHGGAWMGSLRVHEAMNGDVGPVVYLVANFAAAPPPDRGATHLSIDEARTLFHEYGHALHGPPLSPCIPASRVLRSHVILLNFPASSWKTGSSAGKCWPVPNDLMVAIRQAEVYGQGFATVELIGCSLSISQSIIKQRRRRFHAPLSQRNSTGWACRLKSTCASFSLLHPHFRRRLFR